MARVACIAPPAHPVIQASKGAELRFGTTVERVLFEDVGEEADGTRRPKRVTGIAVRRNRAAGEGRKAQEGGAEGQVREDDEEEIIEASSVVLAGGHSARVLFEGMHEDGVKLAYQSFAAGFRIEHPQVGFCLSG